MWLPNRVETVVVLLAASRNGYICNPSLHNSHTVGEIVTLIGANGAGKSTLMMTICGNPRARTGTITHDGQDITDLPTHAIMRRRIAQAPEGRRIFPGLSVEENLVVATSSWRRMGASYGDVLDLLSKSGMTITPGFRSARMPPTVATETTSLTPCSRSAQRLAR